MSKPKTRKVKVLQRDDTVITDIKYTEQIIETDEPLEVLEKHAHIQAVLADPYDPKADKAKEEVEEVEEKEEEPKEEKPEPKQTGKKKNK